MVLPHGDLAAHQNVIGVVAKVPERWDYAGQLILLPPTPFSVRHQRKPLLNPQLSILF